MGILRWDGPGFGDFLYNFANLLGAQLISSGLGFFHPEIFLFKKVRVFPLPFFGKWPAQVFNLLSIRGEPFWLERFPLLNLLKGGLKTLLLGRRKTFLQR